MKYLHYQWKKVAHSFILQIAWQNFTKKYRADVHSSSVIETKRFYYQKRLVDPPEERPLGIQIFGADPYIMAETAQIAESFGPDLIGINYGVLGS